MRVHFGKEHELSRIFGGDGQAKLSKEAEQALFKGIGREKVLLAKSDMVQFGLATVGGCVDEHEKKRDTSIELKVDAGHSATVYVHVALKNAKESGYQLLHVYESQDGKLLGGNSILILNP